MSAPNDPTQWRVQNPQAASHVHPTFPQDGRETAYDRYEQAQPTNTAGAFRVAQQRVRARDPRLPHDYDAYLAQRVPSAHKVSELPSNTGIDRKGRVEYPES